jgi:hypothetical protein
MPRTGPDEYRWKECQVPRRWIAALGSALAVATIAGCGGSSTSTHTATQSSTHTSDASAFASGYQAATIQLQQTSAAIGAAIQAAPSKTDAQLAEQFRDLAGRWQAALSSLETLTPPGGLASQFNTLKDAVSRAESDLNAITAAAETHNKAAAEQASASLVADVEAARSADAPIRQQLGLH